MLLLSVLLACGGPPAAAPPVDGPTQLAAGDVATVHTQTISAGPHISGTLDPLAKAVIRAEASGSVVELGAELGQRVHKGDVLARIEANAAAQGEVSASAGVAAADADVKVAEREAERAAHLVTVGALAQRDLELAQSALTSARARLKDARARQASAQTVLSGTVVRSPIDGVVSERNVNHGDIVAPGAPLFTVLDPSTLRLNGAVPADAIGDLAVGNGVDLTVQGHGDKPYRGSIVRIAPAVDPTTRQLPVLVSLDNADGALAAGLFAEGDVAAAAHDGKVVPATAITTGAASASVLRVKAGKVETVAVSLGLRDPAHDLVEVTSGLDEGDVVVLGPAKALPPGTAVAVGGS